MRDGSGIYLLRWTAGEGLDSTLKDPERFRPKLRFKVSYELRFLCPGSTTSCRRA